VDRLREHIAELLLEAGLGFEYMPGVGHDG